MSAPAFVNPAACKAAPAVSAVSEPKAAPVYKLVDEKTGAEIALPARMKCWDGAEVEVCEFRPSKFKGNPGYIRTTTHEIYVPSVVGAKIVVVAP